MSSAYFRIEAMTAGEVREGDRRLLAWTRACRYGAAFSTLTEGDEQVAAEDVSTAAACARTLSLCLWRWSAGDRDLRTFLGGRSHAGPPERGCGKVPPTRVLPLTNYRPEFGAVGGAATSAFWAGRAGGSAAELLSRCWTGPGLKELQALLLRRAVANRSSPEAGAQPRRREALPATRRLPDCGDISCPSASTVGGRRAASTGGPDAKRTLQTAL
jgi:hypothetical protein